MIIHTFGSYDSLDGELWSVVMLFII